MHRGEELVPRPLPRRDRSSARFCKMRRSMSLGGRSPSSSGPRFVPCPPRAGRQSGAESARVRGIRLKAEGLSLEVQTVLLTHVRSSLAARQIDVCVLDEPSASEPLATLEVRSQAEVVTSIVVDDAVTHKRVSRDSTCVAFLPTAARLRLPLRSTSSCERAGRSSCLLTRNRRASANSGERSDRCSSSNRRDLLGDLHGPKLEMGAGLGAEHFGEGHISSAPTLGVILPWPRVGFHTRLGLRFGFPVQAPRGEIRSTALASALVSTSHPCHEQDALESISRGGDAHACHFRRGARFSDGSSRERKVVPASYVVMGTRAGYALVPPLRAFATSWRRRSSTYSVCDRCWCRASPVSGAFLVTGNVGLLWAF